MTTIRTKRVYDPPQPEDGIRILVDRVWPRGMTKARLQADQWLKDAAPSTELRKWFGHPPEKWAGFKTRYFKELDSKPETVQVLLDAAKSGTLTLLFSARDTVHNQAVALKEYLSIWSQSKNRSR